jgi:hypothetical protein
MNVTSRLNPNGINEYTGGDDSHRVMRSSNPLSHAVLEP